MASANPATPFDAARSDPADPPRPRETEAGVPGTRFRGVDHTALWRQVEAESARVVVIDLDRYTVLAGRMMNEETGDRDVHVMPESPLNRLFPGADAMVEAWSVAFEADPAALVTHSLSPRHWTYFWRVGPATAVLAAVRHRYGRGAVASADTATIRLLCEHWLAPDLQAMGIGVVVPKRWTRADRRARAAAIRELRAALIVLATAAGCGMWLATGGADTAPDTATRVVGGLLATAAVVSFGWLLHHLRVRYFQAPSPGA